MKPSATKLLNRAKTMRGASTDAEHRLWNILRAKRLAGYKFRRQHPIGSFIVDFVCLSEKLVVEADGGHHTADTDARRDAFLKAWGFRVLRIWNNDIFNNEEGVATATLRALEHPSPQPLSLEGEGQGALNA